MKEIKSLRGSSIIESMVAFSIISMTAFALFPLMLDLKKATKKTDIQSLCQNIVKQKLDQYLAGQAIPIPPALQVLSPTSMSASQVTFDATGNNVSAIKQDSGFMYAKIRYNQFYPFSCRAEPFGAIDPNSAVNRNLGFRECLTPPSPATSFLDGMGGTAWGAYVDLGVNQLPNVGAAQNGRCVGAAFQSDARAEAELPDFRLFVKLERQNPWIDQYILNNPVPNTPLTPVPLPATDARYHQFCPNSWVAGAGLPPLPPGAAAGINPGGMYDFTAAGDSIRVTVTLTFDPFARQAAIPPARQEFAGFPRSYWGVPNPLVNMSPDDNNWPDRLKCSATGVVRPPVVPFRYYKPKQNNILTYNGVSNVNSLSGTTVFQTVQGVGGSGIKGFVVHPLNLSIYTVKTGVIERHSNCSGIPVDCSVVENENAGWSDIGQVRNRPSVETVNVDGTGITQIAVDFWNRRAFGINVVPQDTAAFSAGGPVTYLITPYSLTLLLFPGIVAPVLGVASVTPDVVPGDAITPQPGQVKQTFGQNQAFVEGIVPSRPPAGTITGYFMDLDGKEGYYFRNTVGVSQVSGAIVDEGSSEVLRYRLAPDGSEEIIAKVHGSIEAISR